MNVDVVSAVLINKPVDQVAAFASDPDNVPTWYKNITSVEWKTPRPLKVGSQVAFVAHFLGRRLAYTYQTAEFVAGHRLLMRTSEGPFPMETTYTWEPDGPARTRMTLRNRGTPTGFSTWLAPLIAFAIRRANRKDLALLKTHLEGDAA